MADIDAQISAERALRAGARGYVRKAEAADTVMTAVRRILGGNTYVSDAVAAQFVKRVAAGR